jgi:hypothetical protein
VPGFRGSPASSGGLIGFTNAAGQTRENPTGLLVGSTLGLLAFILAFTFGLAAARFDTRRQVVLDEANAIGTIYLRAGMLPERREEIRTLLRNYVNTRLEAVGLNVI